MSPELFLKSPLFLTVYNPKKFFGDYETEMLSAEGVDEPAASKSPVWLSTMSRISGCVLTSASPHSFFQECLNTTAKLKKFTEELIPELQSVSTHVKQGVLRGAGCRAGMSAPGLSLPLQKQICRLLHQLIVVS